MLYRSIFKEIERAVGPFDLDSCSDPHGYNAHCSRFCSPDNSFLHEDFKNLRIYMNPPFNRIKPFLEHYWATKAAAPGTSGVFILPDWSTATWHDDVSRNCQLLRTFPTGTYMFSRPKRTSPTQRESPGPTPWPVNVWYNPPEQPSQSSTTTQLSSIISVTQQNTQLLTIPGTFQDLKLELLVDSGASQNFISTQLPLQHLHEVSPVRVRLADGDILVSSQAVTGTLHLQGLPTCPTTFLTLPLSKFSAILGQPWLTTFNPQINWQARTLTFQDGTTLTGTQSTHSTIQILKAKQFFRCLK